VDVLLKSHSAANNGGFSFVRQFPNSAVHFHTSNCATGLESVASCARGFFVFTPTTFTVAKATAHPY
jgi:hypothetical protein